MFEIRSIRLILLKIKKHSTLASINYEKHFDFIFKYLGLIAV